MRMLKAIARVICATSSCVLAHAMIVLAWQVQHSVKMRSVDAGLWRKVCALPSQLRLALLFPHPNLLPDVL